MVLVCVVESRRRRAESCCELFESEVTSGSDHKSNQTMRGSRWRMIDLVKVAFPNVGIAGWTLWMPQTKGVPGLCDLVSWTTRSWLTVPL